MKKINFNWIPSDIYGRVWQFVYFLDLKDENNYAYILLAEIRQTNDGKWRWRLFTRRYNDHPEGQTKGICRSKNDALKLIKKIFF